MSMPYEKTYLQKIKNGVLTKVYPESTADQIAYRGTNVQKKLDELSKSGGGTEGALYNADNVNININNLASLNGKDLENFSFIDLMDILNYSNSSVKLTSNISTLIYEVGATVNGITLTATVTKGSYTITKVEFFKGSTSISAITTNVENGGTFTYTDSSLITTSSSYKVVVTTEDGKTSSANLNIAFYNPYYHGITNVNINNITESNITSLTKDVSAKATKKYTYTANDEYCIIAYPKSYGLFKSILDPSGFENKDSMVYKELSIKGVAYYIYQTNATVTCTDFTYTFSY